MYLIGILICLTIGFLAIRFLTGARFDPVLHVLLGLALGFGIIGTVAFYVHILLNQFNRFIPVGIVIAGIFLLLFLLKKENSKPVSKDPKNKKNKPANEASAKDINFINSLVGDIKLTPAHGWAALTLIILSVPLAISGHYFPLGGWDAWSCWSLKAKFIFLGHENWKDMLEPAFWRSNTQYPLLWPLINVWFWDLGGAFDQAVPMLNSIVIALLTAGILLFGLLELTGKLLPSLLASILVTAMPINVILYTSQYSDSLLGLYLLSAFICLLLAEKYKLPKLKILSMVFIGLMAFTKNEGLVVSLFAALGILWHERSHKKELKSLVSALILSLVPAIIFTLCIAPKNEAFVNGLTSTDKPLTWARLEIIAVYPWFEFISGKWNGFWLLIIGGILIGGKKLWRSTLGIMGLTIVLYLGVVMAYYAVNTFFDITWWLSNTLARILFAVIPTLVLWIGLGLLPP